jgi:hypothetical protein
MLWTDDEDRDKQFVLPVPGKAISSRKKEGTDR